MRPHTLVAFYDLALGPVSFDVIPFLVQARMAMEEAACKNLHIVIVPDPNGVDGMFRDKLHLYDAPEKHWRLWNLVIPACQLIGASVTLATDWDQAKKLTTHSVVWPMDWDHQSPKNRHHLQKEIIEWARLRHPFPKLQASAQARRKVRQMVERSGKPLVTITLRNTYEPGRNSDPALWQVVYEELKYRYHVVRLYDTSEALARGVGFGELNLDLRMALYQEAVQNLHPHGGPVVLCWFSSAPFLMFDAARPHKDWRKHWEKNVGLQMGEQLPWARPDQRFVYEETSAETVGRELLAWQAYRDSK